MIQHDSVKGVTYASLLVYVARHDADLALSRIDDSWAVWADEAGLCLFT